MERRVSDIIGRLPADAKLGIAVSGGIDSTCLLHVLMRVVQKRENVVVINVDHGIRGEQSAADSAFVRALAEYYGVKLAFYKADVPALCAESGRSHETEARLVRKQFFSELKDAGTVDYILTAHNQNDNTESILMHVLRGSGINGLIGMSELDGIYVRPFIGITRAEIEEYMKARSYEFVVDATNADSDYNRNFLRNEVLPKLRERFNVDNAVRSLSAAARADNDFIESTVPAEALSDSPVSINIEALNAHEAIAVRLIQRALAKLGKVTDVESGHIRSIMALKDKQTGKQFSFGGVTAVKEYERIAFYRDEDVSGEEIEPIPFEMGMLMFGDGIIFVSAVEAVPARGQLLCDMDRIPEGSVFRLRREGDIFKPYGGKTKKLKDYLIDKKIPAHIRNKLPVLAHGNTVLAVLGVEISDDVKLDGYKETAVQLRCRID